MKYTADLQELWDAGMEETIPAGNGTAMAKEQQTEAEAAQDGKQYAMRGKEDVSYNALVQKPDMQLTKLIDKIGRRDRKAIVDEGYDNALYNGRVGISGMPAVYVSDIEREVHVSKKSLEHGLDRRTDQLSAATQHVGELLKNAIMINMATPKLQTANESYVLLSAGENANGTITPVSFIVNRFTNEVETFDVLKSIKQKKNQPRITAGIGADALLPADSYISIAELINIVKNDFTDLWSNDVIEKLDLQRKQTEITSSIKFSARDKADEETMRQSVTETDAFKRWFADSEVVDDDSNPKAVYHTTKAEFNAFDPDRIGEVTEKNASDNWIAATAHLGFWFNEKGLEKKMGGRSKPYYLKAKRLYEAGTLENLTNDIWDTYLRYGYDKPGEEPTIEMAREAGKLFRDDIQEWYDGIVVNDEEFGGLSYVVFEPNQIKSADEITYDDEGKEIPAENRFRDDTNDYRFSTRDQTDAVSVREYLAEMTPKSYMNDTEVELLKRYQTKLKALQEKQRAGLMRLFRHFVHASPAVLPHAPPPHWLIGFIHYTIVQGK